VFQICTFTGQYAMVIPPLRGDTHGSRTRDVPLLPQQSGHHRRPNRAWHTTLSLPTRHSEAEQHPPGQRHRQQIEWSPLPLRTRMKRLTRKTICVSKSIRMHDIVIGLFVNRSELGLTL
jgi:IS1 transposase